MLKFDLGQICLELRQEESLDEFGNWQEEHDWPVASGLVSHFPTLQEQYNAALYSFFWDDDTEGRVDDFHEWMPTVPQCLRWIGAMSSAPRALNCLVALMVIYILHQT